MDLTFHWHHIFLALWFLLTLSIGWIKEYKPSLIANILATGCFTLYALIIDQHIASTVYFVAMCNSLAQLCMPVSQDKKLVVIRNSVAVLVVIVACAILYKTPIDIIPCIAFAAIRLCEAQQSAKLMRVGIATAMTLWVAFGLLEGLHLMALFQCIIIITFLYRIWSESRSK